MFCSTLFASSKQREFRAGGALENEIGTMPLFWKHVAGHNFSLSMFDCQLVLASV